jgi:RNA polymerase sigma-70 factor (ECF subfamily)
VFRDGRTFLLVPTRANGQLAFETYLRDTGAPNDFLVLTLAGGQIAAMTRFRPLGTQVK